MDSNFARTTNMITETDQKLKRQANGHKLSLMEMKHTTCVTSEDTAANSKALTIARLYIYPNAVNGDTSFMLGLIRTSVA